MPRKYKRKYRKKNYKKKKYQLSVKQDEGVVSTGKPRNTIILYKGIGLPSQYICKLKWNVTVDFNSSHYQEYIINANGPYDPQYALGGSQPMYYDELTSLYDYYNVLSSSVVVNFVNKTAAAGSSFVKCGIFPHGNATNTTGITESTERDSCNFAQLGPNTGDQGIMTVKHYAKTTAVLGKNNDEKDDDSLSAYKNQLPNEPWYWHVFVGSLDRTSTVNLFADITLVYYVRFFNRALTNTS